MLELQNYEGIVITGGGQITVESLFSSTRGVCHTVALPFTLKSILSIISHAIFTLTHVCQIIINFINFHFQY